MLKLTRNPLVSFSLPSAALLLSLLGACASIDHGPAVASAQTTFWGYSPDAAPQTSGPTFWGYSAETAPQPTGRTFWGYSPELTAQRSGPTFWGYSPTPRDVAAVQPARETHAPIVAKP